MLKFAAPKYIALAQLLQDKILRGQYAVGERLPTERELGRQNKVAAMTVRQALGLLVQKGLVERRHGVGNFVIRASQANANVALLFGDSTSVESAHYYRALAGHFEKGVITRKWKLRIYDCLNAEISGALRETREQTLAADHRNDPFTGVIEMHPGKTSILPGEFGEGTPRVLAESSNPQSDILPDRNHFGMKAVEHLAKAGCRRIFFFATVWESRSFPESIEAVMDAVRERGLPPAAINVESINTQGYEMEQRLYQRFASLVRSWRQPGKAVPDGIIFDDDIALRSVGPAILQAGIKVPHDMKIFCKGNEDVRFHYGFPVIRYEVSPRKVAGHLLSVLDRKMDGDMSVIPPLRVRGQVTVRE